MIDALKQTPKGKVAGMVIVLVAIIAIVTAALVSYPRDISKIFVDTSVESMQKNLNASAVYANESIEANYSDLQILQDMLSVELSEDDQIDSKVLAAMGIVKQRGGFDRIGIMRPDSDFLFATMVDGSVQQIDMWTLTDEAPLGQVSVEMQTSPFQTADGGYDAIVYRLRFASSSGKEYIIIAEKNQSTLDTLLSAGQAVDGLSLVVRNNGNVVYSRGSLDQTHFVSYNLFAYLQGMGGDAELVDQLRDDIVAQQSGTFDLNLGGTDYTFIFHRIENTNWVCVQGYSKEVLAGSNLSAVNASTMQLVVLIAALLIAVLASIAVIAVHRVKEEGQRESLERERLFEEMSGHIPSAIVIIEDENPQPRFISYNYDEIVPEAPKSFARADVTEWLGFDLNDQAVLRYNQTGRAELDILKGDRTLRIGVYSLGDINDHLYNVMIATDITESVKQRKLLESSMKRADEASKSKSSFLSSMSHEIRTPLNAVLGFSRLALDKWDTADSEELHDYISKVQSSGSYLLELVSDILDISRIEEGRMEVSTQPMDLGALIDEVRDSFQGQMEGKNICYVVEKNFKPVVLDMDAFHVRQVLNNLVSNACKYTEEGGTVTFATSLTKLDNQKASVHFEVKDTGIGMSPEFLERIFEPFSQDERGAQMKKQLRSSGLGMSICKGLVEMQGGTIAVDSKIGEGSRFVVQLTFDIMGDAEAADLGQAQLDAACLAGARVLIADDVELNRMVLGDFLEEHGVRFDEAEDGKEALDMFEAAQPGTYLAIFMDGRMPVMDGYRAATAIRNSGATDASTVPIIAMTADAFSDDVNHAIMCGMNYHITKPIDFDKVLGLLINIRAGKE